MVKETKACFASVKVSDSLLIVYYSKELRSPPRKLQEHYSLNQRENIVGVSLLLRNYPPNTLFLFCPHSVIVRQVSGIPTVL